MTPAADRSADRPFVNRSSLDRAAQLRGRPKLIEELWQDPASLVLELDADRAPVRREADSGGMRLVLRPPGESAVGTLRVFLGQDAGANYLLSCTPGEHSPVMLANGEQLATLREAGDLLDDTGAGLLTAAVALSNWHEAHPRCSRCGAPTDVVSAGWSRRCPACDAQHFPRTDPAAIMAISDPSGRILLGRQKIWPDKRFSTLAGFVEPGESAEDAVRREVLEEAGVQVGEVTYQGSQPWPFPSSIMLAFSGTALSTRIDVGGDDELAEARWWSKEELALDIATGELVLPPPVSIARRLIEHWYGGEIHDAGGVWR